MIGFGIILIFPVLVLVSRNEKKNADSVRKTADEIIKNKKANNEKINKTIDDLISIKNRRIVPFLEEDQVRVDKLRGLREIQ